ncbi:MAG: DNA polymerase I [bacterium]|nr:DNA polymerase I [bacterium]
MKRLILIDSHAIIHRAYHALPPTLTSPNGEPTHAVCGFTTILLRILRELKPDYIAAAYDLPGATFRHVASERYKATRPETPGDLASQFDKVKEVLEAFDIPVFEKEGFEADDVLGTIVKKLEKTKNIETIIVTGDMDVLQLVRPGVSVYAMRKGVSDMVVYDGDAVRERYGFLPKQMIDFKALKGDASDNIAGVKGIGEKTALTLIQAFGSVEEIYKHLKKGTKQISASVSQKLTQGEEDAILSKQLATIYTSVPVNFDLKDVRYQGQDLKKIKAIFHKFGFLGLLKRLDGETSASPVLLEPQSLFASEAVSSRDASASRITEISDIKECLLLFSKQAKNRIGCVIEGEEFFLITENKLVTYHIARRVFQEKGIKIFFEIHNNFVCYDAKSVIRFLHILGIELGRIHIDVMIASYLTGSFSRDFSYAAILGRELGRPASSDIKEEFIYLFEIATALEKKVEAENMHHILYDIELPITRILACMEERGVVIDRAFLKKLAVKIDSDLNMLTASIYREAGVEFNINSPRQISHILFDVLGLETAGLRKTEKGGVISTGAAELEKLRTKHPIVACVLNYRELAKLKSTYVDVLPELVDGFMRVHTTFNQTVASTGRLSSSNPNLQNIPIMSEYGREIRHAFVAPDTFLLCSFDYSQIELRVAAHMSGDKKMIEAFQKGLDIHRMTASAIYNVALEEVTPEFRRAAKTLNFGILYGMGAVALSESTGMSRQEAKKFIDEYFREFSGVRSYLEKTKEFAQTHGYVETLFGRRRYIPEINSQNWQLKREAERMAINMPIQGTATGDIVKMAMIAIDGWVREYGHEDSVRMILQVHDELVFEIRERESKTLIPEIKKIMENVADLKVPLVVDAKIGKNWGEQEMCN